VHDYKNILIAVDFSHACEQVIQRGIHTSKQNNASVFLIHIIENLPPIDIGYEPMTIPDWYDNETELIKHAKIKILTMAEEHGIPENHTKVISGSPKLEIIQFAENNEVDLIVIGSHGRHGLQRLLGSTSYPILHNATCDVLAVRIKDKA